MHPSHLRRRICICAVQDAELKTLITPNPVALDCIQSFCLKPIKVKGSIPTNESLKDSGPSSVPQSSANPSRTSTQDPSSTFGKKPHTVTTDSLLSTGEQDAKATAFDGHISVCVHAHAQRCTWSLTIYFQNGTDGLGEVSGFCCKSCCDSGSNPSQPRKKCFSRQHCSSVAKRQKIPSVYL